MNDWPETNPSLILRIKDPQNAIAWNELMAIYRPVIYRLARRKGLLHEDAEDLVQGVFLSVAKAIDRWERGEGQPRFRNWLGKIARNAIVNAITRVKPDRATGTSSVMQALASLPEEADTTQALIVECRLEAIRWAAREIQSEFSDATWAIFPVDRHRRSSSAGSRTGFPADNRSCLCSALPRRSSTARKGTRSIRLLE
jgi:RNA polymerase sigma-70 factor, ECF subfamily